MVNSLESLSCSWYSFSMDLPPDVRAFFREAGRSGGKIGGKAKVRKGFACMSPARRRAAIAKAIATRRKNASLKATVK